MTRFHVVIPARYGSSRLPGKPLALLGGKPLVQHTWQRARESGAESVCVATDDARIADAVRGFGGEARMTSPDHASGTDRLAEVARQCGWSGEAIVVNLQGDEPCMPPALLSRVAHALDDHPDASVATLATPIARLEDAFDANVVKVVVDSQGFALYFSRAAIPWHRDAFASGLPPALPRGTPFLRHLGLYAYRASVLGRLASAEVAPLEMVESLEQLRVLHLGLRIHVSVEPHAPPHGVDTPADLARAEALLEGT